MPDNLKIADARCRTCGDELIQKSTARLVSVGLLMIASCGLAFVWPILWTPGVVLVLAGLYLLIWGVFGKAQWCRNCKKF